MSESALLCGILIGSSIFVIIGFGLGVRLEQWKPKPLHPAIKPRDEKCPCRTYLTMVQHDEKAANKLCLECENPFDTHYEEF